MGEMGHASSLYTINPGGGYSGPMAAYEDGQATEMEGCSRPSNPGLGSPVPCPRVTLILNRLRPTAVVSEAVSAKYYGQYTGKD